MTPARAAATRRELDQREHQLITAARDAAWQQIAGRLGYQDRQASQQRAHHALTRTLAGHPVTDAYATA